MPKKKGMLRTDEAALEMGLTERQVRNLFYVGKLQGQYRSERCILILVSSIERYRAKLEKEKGLGRRQFSLL